MKRIPALCLAILLLFCCTAGAEDESLSTVDFEDFTLTYPEDMILDEGEKTDPQLYFYLYSMDTSPDYFTNKLAASDDIVFIPVENGKYVQEIGHSQIWDVLAVKVVGNNRGEETLLYNYAGDWLVDQFKVSEDPDHYFSTFIEGYLPRLFI